MSDEELIESLRLWNRDDAADRIEALVKERDRQYDENVNRIHQQALAENRAERLEAALREILEKPRNADLTYAELFAEVVSEARAALKGADHE